GVAFVVPADPAAPPTLDDLRAWTKDRMADYKSPDRLVLIDELPLTPMQKTDRAQLRAHLQAHPAGPRRPTKKE
ncbi:MAG: AMP-binding enzyme, partial [Pseudonocardiaceae bacterium]